MQAIPEEFDSLMVHMKVKTYMQLGILSATVLVFASIFSFGTNMTLRHQVDQRAIVLVGEKMKSNTDGTINVTWNVGGNQGFQSTKSQRVRRNFPARRGTVVWMTTGMDTLGKRSCKITQYASDGGILGGNSQALYSRNSIAYCQWTVV